MLFPALGMTTAVWLLFAPLLGLESGIRAELGLVAGTLAFVVSLASVWSRRAHVVLVVLGAALGFANFALLAPIGSLASLATCAVALIAAGTAPVPIAEVPAPATAAAPARAGEALGLGARLRAMSGAAARQARRPVMASR
jgi:hypothetical protein